MCKAVYVISKILVIFDILIGDTPGKQHSKGGGKSRLLTPKVGVCSMIPDLTTVHILGMADQKPPTGMGFSGNWQAISRFHVARV